jgi:hypothetical protein
VPHLTVKVVDIAPGTKVVLDGVPLPEGAWNTAVPVDPGPHSIHAEAPGRLPFEGSATLSEKQSKTIAVTLDVDAKASDTSSGPSKLPPLLVAGVGVIGVGVGLGLGYASMKKRDDACDDAKLCDAKGLEDGRSLANTSTIVTSVGAGVLVVGLVWWALTPSSGARKEGDRTATVTPWASRDGGGLAAFGRF